ncbi:MAG: hypothetical protein ACEQSQ_06165 [Candidatus Paceibacteria bacterium]
MIYLKLKNKPKSVKELIKIGFTKNSGLFVVTYADPECTIQECRAANRSFEDLLEISKTYFPRTTEKKLAKTLFKLNKEINLTASYCCTIDKIVFDTFDYGHSPKSMDRYLERKEKKIYGKSPYSYDDIVKLAK